MLRKIFALYPGEEKNACYFSLLAFLWAFAVTSAIKFSDALFLTHVGHEGLPTAYILTSSTMILVSLLFLRFFQVVETHLLYLGTIAIGICFYLFASLCIWNPLPLFTPFLWYGLRIFGYTFLAVMLTCFWTFVDHYYNLQDAKRHYSLFTSAIFVGIAAAGTVLNSNLVPFKFWLFCVLGLLMSSALLIIHIAKNFKQVHNELELDSSFNNEDFSYSSLFRSIFSSKFTLLLVSSCFLTYLILSFTEYNYMGAFEEHFLNSQVTTSDYVANPKLESFIGQCMLTVSLINIIIGLFIYSRVIRRFGVTSLLIFTPLVLLTTFIGWNFSNALIFPMLGYFVDEGSIYIIEDSNLNLMLNGVPTKIKYKIRLLLESFFEPFGMLVSGLLLSLPTINSKYVGLIFASLLIFVALLMKRGYLKAIYKNLMQNAIHFERPAHKWFSSSSEKQLLSLLQQTDEKAQSFALEGLIHFDNPAKVLKILNHQGSFAKLRFIELLPKSTFSQNDKVLDHLNLWALETEELQARVYLYLAKLGLLSEDLAQKHLHVPNRNLKAAALITLKKPANEIQELLTSEKEEEICLALEVLGINAREEEVTLLFQHLNHPSLIISRTAALSLAESPKPIHGHALIQKLKSCNDHKLRMACLHALGKINDPTLAQNLLLVSNHFRPKERRLAEEILYKMGPATLPTLVQMTQNTKCPDLCRLLAGRVLGRTSPSELHAILYNVMQKEISRALFYNNHYLTIQNSYPELDLTLLVTSLKSSYHSVLDFIIQILGVAGELEDCELLSHLIRSTHPKIRSQVVEALEKTCDAAIFRLLDPLLNEHLKNCFSPSSLEQLLETLAHSPLQLDQVIAATLKHSLNVPDWKKTLQLQLNKNEEIFHNFALELLET